MSEFIEKISEALALAQGEFAPVVKNKTNPHFKSTYADLSSVFEATRPALSKNGLAISQFPDVRDGRAGVITLLVHKSGQWFADELMLKPQADTPQAVGGCLTYAKRYSAQAILGVDGEEDDDNQGASNDAKTAEEEQARAKAVAEAKLKADAHNARLDAMAKANEEQRRAKGKFDAEFKAKMEELAIDQKIWREVYIRLLKANLGIPEVQKILDEMEIERIDKEGGVS